MTDQKMILVIGTVIMLAIWAAAFYRQALKARPKPKVRRRVKTPLTSTNPIKPRRGNVRRSREDYAQAGPYGLKKLPSTKMKGTNREYFDKMVAHLGEHHAEEFEILVMIVEGWAGDRDTVTDAWFVMDCIRKGYLAPVTNVISLGEAVRQASKSL